MNLELTEEEKALLKKAVNDYLARLREDIYRKRTYAGQSGLKREEVLLVDMLRRLAE